MISAVCFDLDGVYFLNGKSNFIKALVDLGVAENEAKRVFLQSDEMNRQYKEGKMTDNEFWAWALNEWKLSMSVPEVIELLIKGYETNSDAVEYVKKVRKAGYKTLICTNNFPARIEGLQKRFGFLDDFDLAILSYEVGASKPRKEIFEQLVKRSGVNANEIFYSDDNEEALSVAKELGIKTHLYIDYDSFVNELQYQGVTI